MTTPLNPSRADNAQPLRASRAAPSPRWAGLTAQAHVDTPLGGALLVASDAGLAGCWFDAQAHHPGDFDLPTRADHPAIAAALEQLAEYWRGARQVFELALDLRGTAFQQAVWRELLRLPCGGTASYGAIAQRLGKTAAVRAVGAAVGRNPVSVIVPCHRVLGGDGSLTGYAGGLDRKLALLRLEGAQISSTLAPVTRRAA
jgi:methylated-DNA-[protein]-cysteine S-methyltransferase